MLDSETNLTGTPVRGIGALQMVQLELYSRVPLAVALAAVAFTIIILVARAFIPSLDPNEPPLLESRIPIVGHIIGIIQHQTSYHKILSDKNPKKKCVTLPMLNGKLYAIYDPYLCQQVLRAKLASFDPFQEEFAQKVFGLSQATYDKIRLNPQIFPDFTDAIHQSFQTHSLAKMNMRWLTDFAAKMDPISNRKPIVDPDNTGKETISQGGGIEVENFFLWCRDVMTLATTRALYGDHDPFIRDKSLIEASWVFEEAVPYFLMSLAPSLTMPRSYQARKKLQATMSEYYTAEYHLSDPTASTLTVNRANALRKYGFTGNEIGLLESILPVVSTLNAIPTLYWLLLYILPNQSLVDELREEIAASIEMSLSASTGVRTIIINISKFESDLPLLVSCYREALRLCNHTVCNRRIMEDLSIKDETGRTYLLKKGVDVQLPAGVTQRATNVWGSDADQFRANRFGPPASKPSDADRTRKIAYMPFGGGRHLCPGRNFAFAEIVGCAAVLLLGFDIEASKMEFGDMRMRGPRLSSGTVKPVNGGEGLGAKINAREEFANVAWKFRA